VIVDLLPNIAQLYFLEKIPVSLSSAQIVILLAVGLQHKTIDQITEELTLGPNQILALFNKTIRKITQHFRSLQEKSIETTLPKPTPTRISIHHTNNDMTPLQQSLDEELADGEKTINKQLQNQQKELMRFSRYSMGNVDLPTTRASEAEGSKIPSTISVKSTKQKKKHNHDQKSKHADPNESKQFLPNKKHKVS